MINAIAMFPVLVANDLKKLKEFYENNFGFITEFYQDDFYLHLLQPESKIQLAFMVPNHPSQPEFLHPTASSMGMVISFEVENAKDAYEKARQSGLNISFEHKVEEFGVAHFMIRDPAGFILDVVEHLEQ